MMSLHADKEGKVYNSIKLRVSAFEALLHLAVLAWFAFGSFSYKTMLFLEFHFANPWLQYLFFIMILGFVMTIITLPLDYYSEFIVEHNFGLSHQTIEAWAVEKAKSVLLSVVIGLPIAFAFYYLIRLAAATGGFISALFCSFSQ
jgi:STE24 endopeptidase